MLRVCELVNCTYKSALYYLFYGVGWSFHVSSYTTFYTIYLFDNQMKIMAGVGCRNY
jgi:hypothetical protein